jgi:hypothetical protein
MTFFRFSFVVFFYSLLLVELVVIFTVAVVAVFEAASTAGTDEATACDQPNKSGKTQFGSYAVKIVNSPVYVILLTAVVPNSLERQCFMT